MHDLDLIVTDSSQYAQAELIWKQRFEYISQDSVTILSMRYFSYTTFWRF